MVVRWQKEAGRYVIRINGSNVRGWIVARHYFTPTGVATCGPPLLPLYVP